MPGNPYIDISIKPGIDDGSLLAMKMDTQQRLSQFSAPNIPLGNTVPSPKYIPDDASQRSVMDGVHSYYDLIQASMSPDKKLRDAAGDIIAKKLDTDPVAKGVGGSRSIPYDKSMDKYLTKDYGYRPERGGVAGNEDFYYRNVYMNKTWTGRRIQDVYTGIGRAVIPAVFKAAEGLGYLGTMITSLGSNDYWSDVADNSMARWLQNTEQKFKDQVLPVYHSIDYNNKGFFAKLGDPTFWTDEFSDGVSFLASMVLSNYGVGLLGKLLGKLAGVGAGFGETPINFSALGKYGKALGAVGKGVDYLVHGTVGDNISEVGRWMLNTASESAFEASQGYQTSVQQLTQARNNGENSLSDAQIRKISGERAASRFNANMMILSLSNAVENKFIFNPIFKKLKGADWSENPAARLVTNPKVSADPEELLAVERKAYNYSTKAGKIFNLKDPNSRLRFYGPSMLTTATMEGLWEENAQLAAERLSGNDNLGWSTFWNQLGKQTADALRGKDTEAAMNIGLGSLIGIFGTGISTKLFAGNQFFQGERKKISEDTDAAVQRYNVARREFLSLQDIWQRSADGSIKKDGNGGFQVDDAKVKGIVEGLQRFTNKQEAAALIVNPLFRQHLQNDALGDFVFAAKRAGIYDRVVKGFDNVEGLSPEEIEKLGFNPSEVNDPKQFKETAKKYGDIYERAESSRVKLDETNNTTLQEDSNRKSYLYKALTRAESARGIAQQYNDALLQEPPISVYSPGAAGKSGDVLQYNSLLYQQSKLRDFKAYAGDNGGFYKDYIRTQQQDINNKIRQLRPAFNERIKDGELTEMPGGLLYSDKKYSSMSPEEARLSFDIDNDTVVKTAEVNNTVAQNEYTGAKLSDAITGQANYRDYIAFGQAVNSKDNQEAQVKKEGDKFTVTTPEGNKAGSFDTKEEADKTAEEVTQEAQTIQNQEEDQPPVPIPPGPTTETNVDVVPPQDTEQTITNQTIVNRGIPDELSSLKPVSYYTPLITSKDDTINISGSVEQISTDDYSLMRADFIRRFISQDFEDKYRLFLVVDSFPEVYKNKKDDQGNPVVTKNGDNWVFSTSGFQGEVLVLETLTGERPLISSFFPNDYKDIGHLPVIFSFNRTMFQQQPLYDLRANIKANKEGKSMEDVKSFYEQEIAIGDKARKYVRDNPNDRIQVDIVDLTDGINPKTFNWESVQNRFGEFELNIAVPLAGKGTETGETYPGSGIRYPSGTVYAKIGKYAFPIATGRISEFADVHSNIQGTLSYKFKTPVEAQIIRDQYLSVMVNTDKRKNFFTIDKNSDDTYSINYRKASQTDIDSDKSDAQVRRDSPITDVGIADLNVSRVALKEGYRTFDPSTGQQEFVGAEDYNNFIKPRLQTNLKKVVDRDGKTLYTKTVNPYFSFMVTDAKIPETGVQTKEVRHLENFNSYKERIDKLKGDPAVTLQAIKNSLELELKKDNISLQQFNELIDLATPKMGAEDLLHAEEVKEEPTPIEEKEGQKEASSILDKYKNKPTEDVQKAISKEDLKTYDVSFSNLKHVYDSFNNKIYILDSGILTEVNRASSKFTKLMDEFVKQFPYVETDKGNSGFAKIEVQTPENQTFKIYIPPTKVANPEIITEQLGMQYDGNMASIMEKLGPEEKQKLSDFINKYC